MSRSSYPLKFPHSVKAAAQRLAEADGVSLNQFIAAAVSTQWCGKWLFIVTWTFTG